MFEVEKQAATVAEIEGVEHQLQNQPETLHVEPEKVPEEIMRSCKLYIIYLMAERG